MLFLHRDHEVVGLHILMNVASFMHLFQALKHLASDLRDRDLVRDCGVLQVCLQGHVKKLNLHVLHALPESIAIVTNNSIALFVVHHSEIVGLLGHDGAVFA
jgi:hypothetical protein